MKIPKFIYLPIFLCSSLSFSSELKVPKTNIEYWNKKNTITSDNNCYNYSTNRIKNDFAQPGDASNNIFTEFTCDDIRKSAESDLGVLPTDFFEMTSTSDDTLIALVVAPKLDFHWYRRDSNNQWSHKPGSTKATTFDNSHQLITSPETADRGPYTEFCGYYKIKNFPTNPGEQNAGFVRIGNMKKLPSTDNQSPVPPKNKSYIELQKYSGRRNPRIDLDQILLALPQLSLESNLMKYLKLESSTPEKLGEQKFVLNDLEGVFTEKNTVTNINSYLSPNEILQLQKLFSGK